MGIYDVNLKKTGVGYQFDHNVYIGIQTNDNRVVTFKDLDDAVATQIAAAGGGEDIELFITKSEAGSHQKFGDRISFHRDNTPYVYDIAPQYVTSPGPISSEDFSNSKVCLLKSVVSEGQTIGYQIYTSNYAPASILTLNIGASTYTYDGSTGVEINFDTIPTINADSVAITTNVDNNSTNTEIPTALAVYGALALAPGIAHVVSTSIDAASAMVTSITYTGGSSRTLSYTTIAHALDDAILQWGQPVTYATVGTHTYNITLPTVNTIPTINADSVNIVTTIPENDTSTDIPTAGAVHKFASAAGSLRITEAASGYLVGVETQPSATTQTLAPVGSSSIKWATTAVSAGTANQWINANITGQLNHSLEITVAETTKIFDGSAGVTWTFSGEFTTNNAGQIAFNAELHDNTNLSWGTPISYGSVAGQTKTLTLPTVNTIPTINADSVSITTQITSSHSSAIPTEGAVYEFAAAAGSVKATAASSGYILGTSSGVTVTSATIAYAPVGTNDLLWATSADGMATANKWINANITGTLNKTFTVFGQAYNGADNKTITASTGITVSTTGVVSLDATFTHPTLVWGQPVTYATVANTDYTITLPTVNTIPTINANSVSIATSISSSSSSAIPTEGAVSAAIAGAVPNITAGNNITITTHTNSPNVDIGLQTINSTVLVSTNMQYGSATGGHMETDDWGHIHLYNGHTHKIINGAGTTTNDDLVYFATNGVTVKQNLWVPTISSSSNGTAAANKDYVDGITLTYSSSTHNVSFTDAQGRTTSFTTISDWEDISNKPALSVSGQTVTIGTNAVTVPEIGTASTQAAAGDHTHPTFSVFGITYTGAASKTITAGTGLSVSNGEVSVDATFHSITLSWSGGTNYVTFGTQTYSISLPNISTIPTINASSIAITGTISGTTDIPTDQAVNNALTNYVPKSAFSYNAATGVLTLTI